MRRHGIVLVILTTALAGCHGTGSAGPQTPSDATPGVISLNVGDFTDTDQNRYRDTTTIIAYVYAASGAYPIPMRARGSFEFELQTSKGETLKRWDFDEKQTAGAMHQMAPGPGFVFDLSLRGEDKIERSEAEVLCTFRPSGGTPLMARPSAPVAIGPVTRPRIGG